MAMCPMTSTWQYEFYHNCIEHGTGAAPLPAPLLASHAADLDWSVLQPCFW